MKLHEFQSKALFGEYGIPVPRGKVATTSDEAYAIAAEIGGAVVVKAQVHVGGRGKAGGVKLAKSPEEAREVASKILGMTIKGLTVRQVLVDPAANIQQEIYLAITNDRQAGRALIIASAEGGMDIEELAVKKPSAIVRLHIDPLVGLKVYHANNVVSAMGVPREHYRAFVQIVQQLYECYIKSDAELAEINPLVITTEGKLLALDGKVIIDDNALYRQPKLAAMRDLSEEPESETKAREAEITFIKLDGQIGCMVNGAGLAMTTMDMTKLYGEADGIGPANFLDIGGGASSDQVAAALRIILSDSNVKSVLINIFGGITRCDDVARGILVAYDEVKPSVPIIIRLQGTNAAEGRALIDAAQIPNVVSAETLTEAAQKAVEAAKKAM
ncbi:MAG: ADP-forming succinate--CoA ligase subunit beta [Anaerolineae bacterium]|nr:ADP-forming succinate--CoA ligase subunit beta [Anaerolineae bacterium]MDW8171400.1 ADP-forming succinate--CoA ligase subunit beta [Anaerolineae bacterium]